MTIHSLSAPTSLCGKIQEVFSSLQGEGIYWGRRQIFIRFFGCNMKCLYCDEPETSFVPDSEASYLPKTVDQLLEEVDLLEKGQGPHHSISLTGGEPLGHTEFLLELAPTLKERGFRLYLDTNGTLPDRLRQVLPYLDVIAMDIKPPSATGDRPFWDAHRRFLEVGQEKEIFVKIVVTAGTLDEELERAILMIAQIDPTIPLVLQPVTPPPVRSASGGRRPFGPRTGGGAVSETVSPSRLFEWSALARRHLSDVRILGQLHKVVGIK